MVQADQPKLPPAVRSLVARGWLEIRLVGRMQRALFTEAGIEALRQLAADRRFLDPIRYAHILQELGLLEPSATVVLSPANSPGDTAHERLG